MFRIFNQMCIRRFMGKYLPSYYKLNNFSTVNLNLIYVDSFICNVVQTNKQFIRYKSKDKNKHVKKNSETESETTDSNFLDDIQDKNSKTLKINVTSMRLDAVLKLALGLSRNKLETVFYESKIRLNGEKVLKKSIHLQEGDEIDVIKGVNINNKDFLTVARVEILTATAKDEDIAVKIRRNKALTVENYQGNNCWKE